MLKISVLVWSVFSMGFKNIITATAKDNNYKAFIFSVFKMLHILSCHPDNNSHS